MKCSKCGYETIDGNFCTKCGNKLILDNNINDDELIDAYIGKKYKKKGFSIFAFLFSYIYLFYRKMWLLGISFLITKYLFYLFFIKHVVLINIIFSTLLGIFFKKIYLNYATSKVKKIKKQFSNCSREQLINICIQQGGHCSIPAFACVLLYYSPFIILAVIFMSAAGVYDIRLPNKKITLDDLKLTVPESLSKKKISHDNYISYTSNDNSNDCEFSVSVLDKYNGDINTYLKNKYNYSEDKIYIEKVNGISWSVIKEEVDDKIFYNRYTIHNGKVFNISYKINNINNNISCDSRQTELMNTVRFKKND